ncbi:MAG: precorrin-2 C(20)-methyltransferase [Syntrophobacteraceae bacterium]|jgi:precorrin-2/cobalt-factor-2 C20-methyltransferase|nr:precorrin-2 C(20)-methyltransferase [Syntrophobacteraceae bacterium]
MLGILYGIGVGPGDPDLLTLKAVKVLKRVAHVFAAASSKNDYSLAHDIVREHIPSSTPVDQLAFPMTFNSEKLEDAWQANCEQVVEVLRQGKDVAFLTLGDPLTFSTFIYLMRKVRSRIPGARVSVVPGITSFQAAAACAGEPLAEGEEIVSIISGAKGGERLKDVISLSDSVVLMKAYKYLPEILSEVEEAGLQDSCCFISRCGLEGEVIERDFDKLLQMERPNYLSLMLIKRRGLESTVRSRSSLESMEGQLVGNPADVPAPVKPACRDRLRVVGIPEPAVAMGFKEKAAQA